jgi:GDP-L-fucose synthase
LNNLPLDSPIFIAGHDGMVGRSLLNLLKREGFTNLITATRSELDLCNQDEVNFFFKTKKPLYVVIAAAKVGGIKANSTFPAEFMYNNLMIECNLIHQAYKSDVRNLLFLGSSCIYPKLSQQPIKEEYLLSGELERTNEAYALAKIAGIKLCEFYNDQYDLDYRSLMPTNLYGPGDNFNLNDSHVIPSLLRKFHEAKHNNEKKVEIWGTGKARREFMHVDDLADACFFLMNVPKEDFNNVLKKNKSSHINVGVGLDLTIKELSTIVQEVVGFSGKLYFNTDMPDGTPKKLLDVSCMADLGWNSSIRLKQGLIDLYDWYKKNASDLRI